MAVLIGLMLIGTVYESLAEAADARAYPPSSGQMVDVGGYSLHIECVGTGSPTVVIDYGWGDTSEAWSSVRSEAAKTTRVCTYDHAGAGYSDVGPLPRSAKQLALELHTLLHQAGVPGPYVIAGHSAGGLTAQVFAHEYATDVAGVLLIDSMSPSSAKPSAQAASDTPQTDREQGGDWLLTLPARIGVVRLLSGPSSAQTANSVTPRFVQTVADEGRGIPEGLAQVGAIKSLGSVPLIVLSRGRKAGQDQDWQKWQTDFLQLSSNSRQLFADKSGHNIQVDQPEAAVGAIVQMVEQIRGQ